MTLEIHKFLKEEIFPIINQVDSRLQNFEIQFLKEAAKFVRDFKSLAKEADESLAKHKTLELEIERLLRAVVSQDIMSIVQNPSVVDSPNLQTELDRTKERLENCIIKKENEYAKLWNDWYKKCEECKYDKISYDKAYNDMQQKIERLQAQLGDQKGKSQDTPCVSNTLDPLSQKLENENVELEFQVRNYEKEIAHLKTTYKNLFDSISVTRAQTKTIIDSLQHKLHDTIYENAKLRAQLFDKVSDQVDTTKGTSTNTKFANQKVDETNDLSNPVTSNSVPTPQESKNVIAPGMFRINPFKPSREEKYVPNKVRASVRTTPITVSQPHVVTKKDVNSDSNGLSSTGVDNTAKTRRPQPRSNTKNDRVPSASKSSCNKNKEVEVEEHHRNLLLSKNKKHMSSECKHVKLDTRNDQSEVICAMCKQCLITANHDVCMLNYVNDMNSRGKKQKANVSNTENQKKQKPKGELFETSSNSSAVGIANQHGNGNVVSARAEGNSNRINGNPIRCYNYQGEGHYASNCTQASTAGTQTYSAPVYDSDGLAKSLSAHQEIHKIIKDKILPIVNQVDARVQNFKIQFSKEAAKFVQDFKSLAKEADESLAKHKALELEIECLLRAVVNQLIMSIVQNNSVVDASNLQTELERTKERFENCIIKKEKEYAKL
ncbi:hypothetical protein Tco_0277018 [Tanacetum coccineum]